MSRKLFYVNDTSLEDINFNGTPVNNVYYNNELVWNRYNYSWGDLYQVCQDKRNGVITEWPQDIELGMRLPIEVDVNGFQGVIEAELIDMDTEGDGILVFQQKTTFDRYFKLRDQIDFLEIGYYVLPLTKGYGYINNTTLYDNTMGGDYGCLTQKVWDLSVEEITGEGHNIHSYADHLHYYIDMEYTGYRNSNGRFIPYLPYRQYPYFMNTDGTGYDKSKLICYVGEYAIPYLLRSKAIQGDNEGDYGMYVGLTWEEDIYRAVREDGTVETWGRSDNRGYSYANPANNSFAYSFPCFAIG